MAARIKREKSSAAVAEFRREWLFLALRIYTYMYCMYVFCCMHLFTYVRYYVFVNVSIHICPVHSVILAIRKGKAANVFSNSLTRAA